MKILIWSLFFFNKNNVQIALISFWEAYFLEKGEEYVVWDRIKDQEIRHKEEGRAK